MVADPSDTVATVTRLPIPPGPWFAVRVVRTYSRAVGPARAVLTIIATYADDHGVAWPSLDTIADGSGLSVSTVQRAIRTLVDDLGELSVTRRGGGRGCSTRYRITISPPVDNPVGEPGKVVRVTPFTVEKGGQSDTLSDGKVVTQPAKGSQSDQGTTKELPREGGGFSDHCPAHVDNPAPPPCRGCMRTREANDAARSAAAKAEREAADRRRRDEAVASSAAGPRPSTGTPEWFHAQRMTQRAQPGTVRAADNEGINP